MRPYKKGDIIGCYPYVVIRETDIPKQLDAHVFAGPKSTLVRLVMGDAMLFNHSIPGNMRHELGHGKTFIFYSTRNISVGDELLHDYGRRYWKSAVMNGVQER